MSLGVMMSEGQGVPKDEAGAVRWFRRAADAGDPRGMYGLGLMYYQGAGVERDLTADELSAADLERGQDRFFELREDLGL